MRAGWILYIVGASPFLAVLGMIGLAPDVDLAQEAPQPDRIKVTSFRTAKLCETLLRRHENLFMSIRLMRGGARESVAMDRDGNLKPEWKRVLASFPDSFVFGSESMHGTSQSSRYDHEFILYQKLLAQLPPPVARRIASANARSIYRPGPQE